MSRVAEPFEYDALIIVTPGDFLRVAMHYNRLSECLPVRNIYFVGSDEVGRLLFEEKRFKRLNEKASKKIQFINENSILSFDDVAGVVEAKMQDVLLGQSVPRGIVGWYYQQFLKFNYARYMKSDDDYYFVWDGDTIPCKTFTMFDEENVPYFDLKNEYHEEYFNTLEKILPGMKKVRKESFIAEHMIFSKELVLKMLDDIEKNTEIQGDFFWEKIINCLNSPLLQSNSFSEFETYGTYVFTKYPEKCRLRDWHSFRYGASFFDVNTICDRDFDWLSKDFYAISFEKNQTVRFDQKNLFDNPKYQSKLSAKVMLQIAQEEFTQGYKEVWGDEEEIAELSKYKRPSGNLKNVIPKQDFMTEDEYLYYWSLGNVLKNTNVNQAYLCYENARFLCPFADMQKELESCMEQARQDKDFLVRNVSIVIVSYNAQYLLEKCLESIWKRCDLKSTKIIVVDNDSHDETREFLKYCPYDIDLYLSDKNLGFSGGCNIGIKLASKDDDIFFLNNDTRMCHNSLFWLRMGLYERDDIGATGGISNYDRRKEMGKLQLSSPEDYVEYGNKNNIFMKNPYEELIALSGFALLVKRNVLDEVGGFDEAFNPGYFEDDDLGIRIKRAGYRLIACYNSFIYHAGSQSFIKVENLNEIGVEHKKLFMEKWGIDNIIYHLTDKEADFVDKLKELKKENLNLKVLEIGCGCGVFMGYLQMLFPKIEIIGIEEDEKAVEYKISSAGIILLDWTKEKLPFLEKYFDYIIICDRFEKGIDKKMAEKILGKYLKSDGELIF